MNNFPAQSACKRTLDGIFLLIALLFLSACSSEKSANLELTGKTMGTTWNLTLPPRSATLADAELYQKIEQRLKAINQQFSTYDPQSTISRFNRHLSSDPFTADEEFLSVVGASLYISEISHGAFDMTMAPLIKLWGFDEAIKFNFPSDASIQQILQRTGSDKLMLSWENRSLTKTIPSLSINLSAIAKGFAVDEIANLLDAEGVSDYLFEIGGELIASGKKRVDTPWRVAIAQPAPGERLAARVITLEDTAIATSGDYNNFFTHNGIRYSHTIDPTTGKPVTHHLTSVTVLHESAMFADAYATALMVMGVESGMKFAEEHQLAVYMISRQQDGSLFHVTSENFPR